MAATSRCSAPLNKSWLSICCTQVVPDLPGGDDDVVVAELQVVPDGGVEMVIVQLAPLLRPWNLNLVHVE
jgi:hypothetical protein